MGIVWGAVVHGEVVREQLFGAELSRGNCRSMTSEIKCATIPDCTINYLLYQEFLTVCA